MRLPFPERIPLWYAICFAAALSAAQLLEGTYAPFSLCCFLFIIVATLAFNLAGGFSRSSGGYVFFYATLAVIVGLFWKARLGEPATTHLTNPMLTIEAHLGGIAAMFGAVFVSQKLTAKRPLLGGLMTHTGIRDAAIGCMIIGFALTAIVTLIPYDNGSILSALAQLNYFLPLALILGVIAQIRRSGGTSSMNLMVWVAGWTIFLSGVLSFSKQGMFTPMLCWLVAAASQRYRITMPQAIGFLLASLFMVYYMVPYSQYGRTFKVYAIGMSKTEALQENLKASYSLLTDLDYVRSQYEQTAVSNRNENAPYYYDTDQGLFDRIQMIAPDDALINVTEQRGPFGFAPLLLDIEGLVPHFLWPAKPHFAFGNVYAHEIGMIGEEDITTGISFSPIGEAFHTGRWIGVLVVAPLLWITLFTLFDSLCGDTRQYPWGLLAIMLFSNVAPEGMLGGVIYLIGYGVVGIVFASLAAAYVMPLLGSVFTSFSRPGLADGARVRSIPRRLPPVSSSESSGL